MLPVLSGRLALERAIMLTAAGALLTIGIATIYAAGNPEDAGEFAFSMAWKKQLVFAAMGLACLVAVNLVSYRRLGPASYWLYGAVLIALAVLLLDKWVNLPFVPIINGSRRWLTPIPGVDISIQPSEFCKIAFILALAWYLRYRRNYRRFAGLVGPFALTLLAMGLIILEPDLGTVLLMMPILFAMLFAAGAKTKHLLLILLLGIVASPLLWQFMENYQKTRISSVLLQNEWVMEKAKNNQTLARILAGSTQNLRRWEVKDGWQVLHSRYAVASGGLTGYGFAKGPYIKYSDLPERHNDFIFAVIAHQWGFLGACLLIFLYAVIITCGVDIAMQNTEPFGRLVAVGIVAMFAVQIIVNISMTIGVMPITGLTLPFVSYGGSSLLVSMLALGILNNIGRSRPFSVARRAFEQVT